MFQATRKIKLLSVLEDIRKGLPDLADELEAEFGDDTTLVIKAAPSDDIEVIPDQMTVVGRISTLAVDTYNEVVLPEGGDYESYRKNNVVLWGHDYYNNLPHAENTWIRQYPKTNPTEVRAASKYYEDSERGMEIFKHREQKRPLGYSIGFIPTKSVYRGEDEWVDAFTDWRDRYAAYKGINANKIEEPYCIYQKWKLLEYSDVVVPANPDAVSLFVSKGFIEPEEVDEYTITSTDEGEDDPVVGDKDKTAPKPDTEEERIAVVMKSLEAMPEIQEYLMSLMEATEAPLPDEDDPPEGETIPEVVKEAMSEVFDKLALEDIEINTPAALKEFSVANLIAARQGKLQ